MTIGGAGLLLALIASMFIAFFAINRRLRGPATLAPQLIEAGEGVHIPLPDGQDDNEGAGVK